MFMSYIHKSLLDGEKILYLTRRHKIVFTYPVLWLLLSAILFGVKWVFVFKPEINFALSIFSGIFLGGGCHSCPGDMDQLPVRRVWDHQPARDRQGRFPETKNH